MDVRLPEQMKFTGNISENFKLFKQNFEIFLLAKGKQEVQDEVKVALLLNCMGQEAINVYNTFSLNEAEKKQYQKVIDEFGKYCNPKKNVIYERYMFFSRKQEEGEGIDKFVTDLKKLAESCEFNEQKDSLIRDRIVLGITNLRLQERLLTREDLNLEKAINECRVAEISKLQIDEVQKDQKQVYGVRKEERRGYEKENKLKKNEGNKFDCRKCLSKHGPKQCKAYGQKCFKCGLVNHFAKACTRKPVKKEVKEVSKEKGDDNVNVDKFFVNSINTQNCKALYKEVDIKGKCPQKCSIKLKKCCQPVAHPARRVPLAIKEELRKTLNELEQKGIISKTDSPGDWVSNLVIIEKSNGSLRLCLNPQDLNKAIQRNFYTIPTIEDISSKLCNKSWFTVLDFKDGFYQVELDHKSSELCTFSTVFGCYKFLRLPFGLTNAPEYFQKVNEENFGDIEGVIIYFDDLLIAANTEQEHDAILKKVIERAQMLNIKFNQTKLQYKVNEVNYVGHVFCKDGMKPSKDRVKAIQAIENPTNLKELQRVLGMLNYLRGFIPNFAKVTSPIRELLRKDVHFQWNQKHTEVLNKLKDILASDLVLGTFQSDKPIVIQTDASKDGLGCCLMQDKPTYHGSRSLTAAEKNYSQCEKELLAVVFAVSKFHHFIYGRDVKIITDNKPLLGIMKKDLSKVPSPRLQRLKLKLIRYNLNFEYCPGKHMYIADLLSRSYIKDEVQDDPDMKEIVHSIEKHFSISEERRAQFEKAIQHDSDLSKLIEYIKNGWPKYFKMIPNSLRPYWQYQNDITLSNNLLLLKDRLIVPRTLIQDMLDLLHETHFGMTKTKQRAKEMLYWVNMNAEIEKLIRNCQICERYSPKLCKEPMIPHEIPNRPFKKVASDICDYGGKSYLILMDYYSKWLEIKQMKGKTSYDVINALKEIFSIHGIPDELISDNMPYNSYECRQFAKQWNFKICTSSPHYPKSNGLAEKGVGIAKMMLRKDQDLMLSLLNYRTTPIVGLNLTPSQLLMGRNLKTKIPIDENKLLPNSYNNSNIKNEICRKRELDKKYYDLNCKVRNSFNEGQFVVIQNQNNNEWEAGQIVKPVPDSPRSYIVKDSRGAIVRRNSSHLKSSESGSVIDQNTCCDSADQNCDSSSEIVSVHQENERPKRQIKNPVKFKDYQLF
ncbi:uncharacterized protein K02A2.6-like [Sitophilus oryzae]|uniref:RNA-directed DNA polymerase n=1 Tax=Sitophilus oryzae TaxID=7048 RepID=A0A6J2YI33_SITOR|nr:uncharacterized protein K02A2.6-like [Sitophilus oryzae]XP_030763067.1 uncharacterized protein K02A2.6-like [Sitophilus oryzae]